VGWKLMRAGKRYHVVDRNFVEVTPDGAHWPIDADVYHKRNGHFYAGHKHIEGRHYVYEKNSYHSVSDGPDPEQGDLLFRVNLFEDVSGQYVPCLEGEDHFYMTRPDGKLEYVARNKDGLRGKLVDDLRSQRQTLSPNELERLLHLETMIRHEQLFAELRELQRTLVAMRERLELQEATHQDAVQKAVATAQAELVQARNTIVALRDELEKERADADNKVNAARRQSNAEIMQLRKGTSALRDSLDLKDVQAANSQQEAVSDMQQELHQLRNTITLLRDQIDDMKKQAL